MENPTTPLLPSKEQIQDFPRFQNLSAEKIVVINTQEQCLQIEKELSTAALLGFDSESKPTFQKGEVSTGPHLIQLATFEKAYLFQVNAETLAFLKPIFANPNQFKIGFGLSNDKIVFKKKGIELNSIIELSKSFSSFGIKSQMGLKNAMALLFKINLIKSKRISTSNWSRKTLTEQQIHYAVADAYAPLLVFKELSRLNLIQYPKGLTF